jgi:hypothetical protein
MNMKKWPGGLTAALLAGVLVGGAGGVEEQDEQRQKALRRGVTDPKEAGPDFAVQGEYLGTIGTGGSKLAAQVIALGGGNFDVHFLRGGLPGQGWDGKIASRAGARTEGGKTVLKGSPGESLTIMGGKLAGVSELANVNLQHVHRKSPTAHARPPQGAVVLFDGTEASAKEWNGGRLVEGDLLNNGITSKKSFKDFRLHLEFRLPFMPYGRGQGRANSGVYLQNRYEVQILDSFGLEGRDNECGGIYGQAAPRVNMCFSPLSWQTYDIDFKAARFDGAGQKAEDARATVRHNGVVIHDNIRLKGPTAGGQAEADTPGPLQLQNHGNPVYFRNIWVVEGGEAGGVTKRE